MYAKCPKCGARLTVGAERRSRSKQCPACGAKIRASENETTLTGGAPKNGTRTPEEPDERYRELEEFCEADPMMREVEEEVAREIEKESRRLEVQNSDDSSDVYIEPTHKEKLARAALAGKVEPPTRKKAGGRASSAKEKRTKSEKLRGMKAPRKPAATDDMAAEALSNYPWQLEKAIRYATSQEDEDLLQMLQSMDKGMREEDYVSLVVLVSEIECRYEAEPPEDLRGILECIAEYVAGLEN